MISLQIHVFLKKSERIGCLFRAQPPSTKKLACPDQIIPHKFIKPVVPRLDRGIQTVHIGISVAGYRGQAAVRHGFRFSESIATKLVGNDMVRAGYFFHARRLRALKTTYSATPYFI